MTTKMLTWMTTILAACHAVPASHLTAASPTAELAGRRAQLIGWLHDYTDAGQYPTDAAGMPRSVFVDEHGVRCPMAELIYRSGHPELVEAVVREHNEVRLAEVTEGPLHDWMVGSGLTLDEIALIQGAADIDMTWMREMPQQETILAKGEVRGRLESAEKAIRNQTAHSVQVAAAQLADGRIPVPKVTPDTRVVPVTAMKSGPSGRPLPVATATWRRQPITLGRSDGGTGSN
ncbi:MAG TPA: hypothetical protein VLB44_24310 [Kofleriaceae bacterium]|nr:hypothetical protein [Kofleriaceae bacterium]